MNTEISRFTHKQQFVNICRQFDEEDPKHKYIFLFPEAKNSDGPAEAVLMIGYYAISFSNVATDDIFSVDSFIEFLDGNYLQNANRYVYILCLTREANTKLQQFFKERSIEYLQGWQIFYRKGYLAKENYRRQLNNAIDSLLKQNEGGNAIVASPDDVRSQLEYAIVYSADGQEKSRRIIQSIRNVETVLELDKRFSGRIRFNEFSSQIFLYGDVPWSNRGDNCRQWRNSDDSALFSIVQAEYGLINRQDFYDAVTNIAMKHCFHPVRDVLTAIPYKGDGFIRKLLPDFLGSQDSEYNFQTMKLFMLGAVARVFQPGVKFDYCPILKGPQGIGKSTFLQLLCLDSEWYNDSLDSLDGDRAAQSLSGSWIVELAELKSLARTAGGVDSVKRFLSAQADKYRPPYAKRAEVYQRQTVFCGTTNKSDFLQDETGNRRFLIIETGVNKPKRDLFAPEAIDLIKSAWAEALHIWNTEKPKLVLPESCAAEALELQTAALSDDGKTGLITEYLQGKTRTCALQIWREALGESGRPQKWQSAEINDIIASFPGWTKMKAPTKFGNGIGSQRGFQYYNPKECINDFHPISETGSEKTPFDD